MTAMTDYLSGLIIFLREAEIHVHGNKGLVSFPRKRNINDVCFWATNDTWNVGYSHWPMDPVAVLTTADRDVSLCRLNLLHWQPVSQEAGMVLPPPSPNHFRIRERLEISRTQQRIGT